MAIPFEIQFADTDNIDKNARPKNRLIKGAQITKFVKSVSTRAKTIITKAFKHYSDSEERVAKYLPVVEDVLTKNILKTGNLPYISNQLFVTHHAVDTLDSTEYALSYDTMNRLQNLTLEVAIKQGIIPASFVTEINKLVDAVFGKEFGHSKDASPVLLACRRVVFQMQALNDSSSFNKYMKEHLYALNPDPIEQDDEKLEELRVGLIKILK